MSHLISAVVTGEVVFLLVYIYLHIICISKFKLIQLKSDQICQIKGTFYPYDKEHHKTNKQQANKRKEQYSLHSELSNTHCMFLCE